jgi:hypothetical protein
MPPPVGRYAKHLQNVGYLELRLVFLAARERGAG